jgi:hypothetical protein
MLAQVLIAEADSFVARWKNLKLPDGRDCVVRHEGRRAFSNARRRASVIRSIATSNVCRPQRRHGFANERKAPGPVVAIAG